MNYKKKYSVILSIIVFIGTALSLFVPLLTANMVDIALDIAATSTKSYNSLIISGVFLVSTILLSIIFRVVENMLHSKFLVVREKELNELLYAKILDKEYMDLKKYKTAEIEQLFVQDIQNIIKKEIETIPSIIRQLTRVVLAVLFLFVIDYKFLIIIFIAGMLGFGLAKFYSMIIKPHHLKVLELNGKANSFLVESIEQGKLIKAYEAEKYSNEYYKKLNEKNIKAKGRRNNIIYGANSGVYAFTSLLYVFAICYGGYAIAIELLTYGSLIALIQLLNNVQNPFLQMSPLLNQLNLATSSKERINQALSLNNTLIRRDNLDFEKIVFDNVSFSYEKAVFTNLSFEINKGGIVLLQGPSGIGKTTIFMLLLGFIKPDNGEIYLINNNKKIFLSSATRSLFSYVPQENILFSGTILDNIYILTGKGEKEAIEALKIANVYDEIIKMPKGLNTLLNERGQGLSLGQIQRILIAIAILKDNQILLLDEFSSALDKANEDIILNNLTKLSKTIIYITHRSNNFDNHRIIKL